MKKICCLLLVVLFPVLCFSGCGKQGSRVKYDKKSKISVLSSGVIASNNSFDLSFDSEKSSVSLLCKSDGKVWSTCPEDENVADDETNAISVRIQDMRIVKEFTATDSSVSRIASEKIDNGVKITYYFDKYEISIPVCYTLRDDSMLVSITGADILESGERYCVIAVQPAPMLCRVSVEEENSYLFCSYGVGGIVDNKANADSVRKFTGGCANVASMSTESMTNEPESSGCGCFGVKAGDSAALCIGEDTAGAFSYNLLAGDKTKLYSVGYPTFFFTDYDYFYGVSVLDGLLKQISDLYQGTVSMGFYPLSGEDADYNGMAECYRNYLIKNDYIDKNKSAEESSPFSVTYLGGVMADKSVLGIPTKKLSVMTDFDDANNMTQKLAKDTGIVPTVRLSGYGKTGVNIGQIAGGYKIPSAFGSKDSRKALDSYLTSNNASLYNDFSVIYYRKSGGGFSYSRSAAKTAIHHVAEISPVNAPMRDFNEELKQHLLARTKLSTAVEKLIKFADKSDISGISFNDFGSTWYSDYSNGVEYGVAAKIETESKEYLESVIKSGHSVAVSGAAFYSSGISDVVFDAPLEPSGRKMFTEEIPFYQMVFHGITPMYSSAINTAADVNYNIMLAAASGTGLGFTFIKNYDPSYSEADGNKLFAMSFDSNNALVKSSMEKYADIYNKVSKSKILSYDILDNNITKTTFENGVCIYANHSASPQDSPVGVISGYDFIMGGEAN